MKMQLLEHDDAPRVGRPRDPRLDEAIIAATLSLLDEQGYVGLSFAAVAKRAGTTKPAIYRRWASKRDLVLEAVFRTQGDDVVANTGNLDADLRTMVRWSLEKLGSPVGRAALAGLLAEPAGTVGAPTDQLALVWRRMDDRFKEAIARGEIREDLDTTSLIVMHAGPAMLAAAIYGESAIDDDWVERIASMILDGVRGDRR
jgi:AcrR family transcriptional regulator